ncbi:MAG: cytosolic protein [Candidatus Handelsmanbacteria bacterium RIFCSPLOWO2_12_FULL_64_10]|uniref:Cytosolic protein n=1 Tax=Handelsmanbacteria sp. (strain RIFCSPLOWO2_12_FULL_64_10) TaxID=1817868 RepID=A0A1F6CRJ2_HANXR|nr:MAG: cytosolic protein [Candidatus Handelsmanbacteria bacterium RIFCSPLOWO2_12_FULL_64_10]
MDHKHVNQKIVNRLSRIEGHVRSIREMVASGRDCSEVLIQIAAVRSALDQAGRAILEDHLEHCIADALKNGRGQEAVDGLKAALKHFIG